MCKTAGWYFLGLLVVLAVMGSGFAGFEGLKVLFEAESLSQIVRAAILMAPLALIMLGFVGFVAIAIGEEGRKAFEKKPNSKKGD